METYLPNILLLAGTGQNSGKTSFACNIIEKIALNQHVIAIKIAPYMHHIPKDEVFIKRTNNYIITREYKSDTEKDSSRMLKAGAAESYYIQVTDDHLEEAIAEIMQLFNEKSAIICESGGLRMFVKPGLFFVLSHKGNTDSEKSSKSYLKYADQKIEFANGQFDFDINYLDFSDGTWQVTRKY